MYDLFNSVKNPKWLYNTFYEADIVTLALTLSYLTEDSSYLNKIQKYIKGPFDYSAKVPDEIKDEIIRKIIDFLKKKYK